MPDTNSGECMIIDDDNNDDDDVMCTIEKYVQDRGYTRIGVKLNTCGSYQCQRCHYCSTEHVISVS